MKSEREQICNSRHLCKMRACPKASHTRQLCAKAVVMVAVLEYASICYQAIPPRERNVELHCGNDEMFVCFDRI